MEWIYPEYEVVRNADRCIACRVCERQCANEVHRYDGDLKKMLADERKCVACHRCVALCPTQALKIVKSGHTFRENANWSGQAIQEVYRQATSGGVLLSSMGNPQRYPVYWDKLLLNASQVTNPPIDPLREPMETKTFLGKKPAAVQRDEKGNILPQLPPQLELSTPILFSAMSYGSISYNAHQSLAQAASALGIYYNTGEGGLHRDFYQYGPNTIVQVASGRFGVHKDYLNAGAAIEIKMTRYLRVGIGGHLPGAKIVGDVSRTRMIPAGTGRHLPGSPPRHLLHRGPAAAGVLSKRGHGLREARHREDRRGAQRGGHRQRDCPQRGGHHRHRWLPGRHGGGPHPHPGQRGHPHRAGPGRRGPAPAGGGHPERGVPGGGRLHPLQRGPAEAVLLGADAVYIGTAALLALGCHLCRSCHSGKCNWGIATQRPDLVKRLNPELGAQRLVNLVTAWTHELKEMMGGMGINSIEAARGNRLMLRGVGFPTPSCGCWA